MFVNEVSVEGIDRKRSSLPERESVGIGWPHRMFEMRLELHAVRSSAHLVPDRNHLVERISYDAKGNRKIVEGSSSQQSSVVFTLVSSSYRGSSREECFLGDNYQGRQLQLEAINAYARASRSTSSEHPIRY